MRSPLDIVSIVFYLFILAIANTALSISHAQAPGVAIAEQSGKGRDRDDDRIRKAVADLDAAGKLIKGEELRAQTSEPLSRRLTLPAPFQESLGAAEIAKKARASVMKVGWSYLCHRCGDWHLNLAGGYAITTDGAIATCAHVLKAPDMKKGGMIAVDYEGNVFPITAVLAHDSRMDAAIVQVDQTLTPLPLNDAVYPGDDAFCLSNPLDQRGYFSRGMVNRFYWDSVNRGENDASLKALRRLRLNVSTSWAPGSSGSPVLDTQGNAIGHVAVIQAMGKRPVQNDDPETKVTRSELKEAIPLITLHSAIPARSVRALVESMKSSPVGIVPAPQQASVRRDRTVSGTLVHCAIPEFASQAEAFVVALQKLGLPNAAVVDGDGDATVIMFAKDDTVPEEGYAISPGDDFLTLQASSSAGAAQAVSSLLQTVNVADDKATWPHLTITDQSDTPYRSFMIDMGRNPHSPETLRHVIDMMWFYKANFLHLHLTDDQLFSWPSRAFPKLSGERAGWTVDDFMALEAYSQARGVTIIPELDVPRHSAVLRKEYPEVFGETTADLATTEEAQHGVETLITEMLAVFKATPYVHIGGGEAGGVSSTDQRNFINRLNRFITAQGKRTIVWEGPGAGEGDNKVAEDVIHINWNTVNFPAQKMLDAGYQVINAAWNPLYIVDHYPRTMFTAVDVERCYTWNRQHFAHIDHGMPTFAKPHITTTADGIIGFCVAWWEGREENILPLCLPRIAAVTSAAWNRTGESNFAQFQKRYEDTLSTLEAFSGFTLPEIPFADPESQKDNHAYRAKVTPSESASQPHFGPARLTNGIPDQFDHFLGFPTQPEPLEILIELTEPAEVSRITVHERALGGSYELYNILISEDGKTFYEIGEAKEGTRGDQSYIDHRFAAREIESIKIITQGCHGLIYPSFSRLSEVMAYSE
ncbi:MAG: family 20 glycosylhydrolase [Verrucomicrobiales bacterium]|nr:family 20 glycosylhydrolase [Verrucomicrobiales bacterium]